MKLQYYFGMTDVNQIITCYIFGFIGVIIMILLDVIGRDITTKYSPQKFSWSYFWNDNAPRFLLNTIIMIVSIRFMGDVIHQQITQFYALIIGIISDKIAISVKQRKDKFNIDTLFVSKETTPEKETTTISHTSSPATEAQPEIK